MATWQGNLRLLRVSDDTWWQSSLSSQVVWSRKMGAGPIPWHIFPAFYSVFACTSLVCAENVITQHRQLSVLMESSDSQLQTSECRVKKKTWRPSLVYSTSNDSITNEVQLWSLFKADSGVWRREKHLRCQYVKIQSRLPVPPCTLLLDWFILPFMSARSLI